MHAATRVGAIAGRAAAIEDRAEGCDPGAALLLAASLSAEDWLNANVRADDASGQSRAEYTRAYLAAYRRELQEA